MNREALLKLINEGVTQQGNQGAKRLTEILKGVLTSTPFLVRLEITPETEFPVSNSPLGVDQGMVNEFCQAFSEYGEVAPISVALYRADVGSAEASIAVMPTSISETEESGLVTIKGEVETTVKGQKYKVTIELSNDPETKPNQYSITTV